MIDSSLVIKVIFIGSSGVGKTSLLKVFDPKNGSQSNQTSPTIAPENFEMEVTNSRNVTVKLDIWDTAGQEQYQSLTSMYYRSSNVALLCFDYENRNDLKNWAKRVLDQAPKCIIVLVITKSDITSKEHLEEMENIAENFTTDPENNCQNYFITSSLTRFGVDELLGFIASTDTMIKTDSVGEIVILKSDTKEEKRCC